MSEAALFICAIALLAAAGIGFVAMFRPSSPHAFLAAPLAGICLLPVPVILLYTVVEVPLDRATLIAWVALTLSSLIVLLWLRPALSLRSIIWPALVAVAIGAFVFWSVDHATLVVDRAGAVMLREGSDQLGYAHFADWLRQNLITRRVPALGPDSPYDSWPNYAMADQRLGAYLHAAMAAVLTGRSPLFSFDLANSVALAAGAIGAAAVLTQTSLGFALLSTGLTVSIWFDLSRTGYFGKVLAYPSLLLFFGLLVDYLRERRDERLGLLMLLLVGLVTLFPNSAYVAAFGLVIIGLLIAGLLGAILPRADTSRAVKSLRAVWGAAILVGFTVLLYGIVGVFNNPRSTYVLRIADALGADREFPLGIGQVTPITWSLENPGVPVSGLPPLALTILAALVFAMFFLAAVVAVWRGELFGAAFLWGSLVFFAAAALRDHRWTLYQISALVYPLCLAGLVMTVENWPTLGDRQLKIRAVMFAGAVAVIVLTLPRLAGGLDWYVESVPPTQVFHARDIEAIASQVGHGPLRIATPDVLPLLVAMVEFGRRGIDLQFSREAWERAFAYRSWPYHEPAILPVATLYPVTASLPDSAKTLFTGAQYRLVKGLR